MRASLKWRLLRVFITAAGLFVVWVMFTASSQVFSLIAGGVGSLLIAGLTYDVVIARHQANLHFFMPNPLFLGLYFGMLVFWLYRASFKMLGAVLTGRSTPRIVHFRTRLRSDLARMVLANTITFTPGTVTLDLNDDHLTVHWFFAHTRHSKAAGEAIKGGAESWIRRVWM